MSYRSHFHYPFVATLVVILHAGFLSYLFPQMAGGRSLIQKIFEPKNNTIKLTDIRRVGVKNGMKTSNMAVPVPKRKNLATPKPKISLEDLAAAVPKVSAGRPGSRPEVGQKKALEAIALKGGSQMRKFLQDSGRGGTDAMDLSESDKSLSGSNVAIKLEVPEGVSPDELNDYELMFYGFQKRTATNYINSLFKNLEAFQKKNPHLNFPMTKDRQIMTGRLTYDEKGNVKQIKMIRWTHDDKLQEFFESVLKDMDVLHNPPHALWEKSGEFSIFFTLQLNG